jgi:hypothetical protein
MVNPGGSEELFGIDTLINHFAYVFNDKRFVLAISDAKPAAVALQYLNGYLAFLNKFVQ